MTEFITFFLGLAFFVILFKVTLDGAYNGLKRQWEKERKKE